MLNEDTQKGFRKMHFNIFQKRRFEKTMVDKASASPIEHKPLVILKGIRS